MDFRKMAITISPPKRACNKEQFLYHGDEYIIRRYLNKISDYYIIYPEYSKESRLHYHGVIKIKDWIKYHKQIHRLLQGHLGFIKIDPIKTHKDNMVWNIYMSKLWGITKHVLNIDNPIIVKRLKVHKPPVFNKGQTILGKLLDIT